ncbi:endonuclease/exonuclease/phosphatase family metal-dependent hydrolase [Mesonia hippocampi]|uniref:Endonuclease/exonuclease/phosphatase family metal-dependent hydrolase n=1 Tax=Mesonia hippocampi TaxID=1628250 RepID=A0A840EZY4_9FLAO|nr:endonuclease/exonuclease/phosphatase family protein [Mesonia hippocampi]MBB4119584.1 endonuclease/exonuclease/phosphatase family metal-dependent hydrolase [Mesonia hippocampi]
MKELGCFHKLLFLVNSFIASTLLLAYFLPYIPPKTFPFISILSLGVPVLMLANLLFCVYWVVLLKKQFLLSFIVLLFGINHIWSAVRFSKADTSHATDDIGVMSYNVRQFNRYDWISGKNIPVEITSFIKKEKPSILSLQEYYRDKRVDLSDYNYSYIQYKGEKAKAGHAIYSKFPIVGKGSLDFKDTYNNAIYTDLLINKDTVRVYNIHLESLKINPKVEQFKDNKLRDEFISRVGHSFKQQQIQVEEILASIEKSPYPCVLTGDLNNSVFSYVYRRLSDNFVDAFKEAGTGLGRTYVFDFISLRIDVVMVDPRFTITGFITYNEKLSDHYPIMAYINIL